MPIGVSLLLVAAFLLMNAFFVVAEFAMVRVRPSQVEMALQEGRKGAKAAKIITDNVNDYLSACQLGITLASLALGWLGEALPTPSAICIPMLRARIRGGAIAFTRVRTTRGGASTTSWLAIPFVKTCRPQAF